TQVAGALGLVVRLEPFLERPVAHRVADPVAEVGRQPAALHLDQLVPAARLVEAEARARRSGSERVLELVAIAELLDGREDLLERRLGDPTEPLERVSPLLLFLRELGLVR